MPAVAVGCHADKKGLFAFFSGVDNAFISREGKPFAIPLSQFFQAMERF